jgi:serine/threonine protein kinase
MTAQPSPSLYWKPDRRSPVLVGGRFLVLDQIGEGATSVIYKVRDTVLDRIVALKVLKKEAMVNARIATGVQRELAVGKTLRHPNLVEIYEAGQHEGWTYLVMEHVAGRDLGSYLSLSGPLMLPEIESLCRQLFSALSALHALKVVHRDIKPNNVMLRPDGVWKLMDFGTSRRMYSPQTVGPAIGTLEYMSPEQLMDLPATSASDVYSAGILLYEAFTGHQPLRGMALVNRCIETPPSFADRRPDVPPWLVATVMRCVQADPAHRFADADAVLASFGSFEPVREYVPPAPAAPVELSPFRPVAELLADTPGDANLVAKLLEEVLRAVREMQSAHEPLTPYSVRFSPAGEIEIGAHGPAGERDTATVAMPKYTAPEVLRSKKAATAKADLYALGFMMYELLLGRALFNKEFSGMEQSGKGLAWMEWHGDSAKIARPVSQILDAAPVPLSTLIAEMMEKSVDKRTAGYEQAIDQLEAYRKRTQPTQEIRTLTPPAPPDGNGGAAWKSLAVAGAAVIATLLAIWFLLMLSGVEIGF